MALEYLDKALKIQQNILGEQHLDISHSYHNIGNVYESQGNYTKAIESYRKSLEIRKNLRRSTSCCGKKLCKYWYVIS